MPDPILAQRLLQQAAPRDARRGGKIFALLLAVGLVVVLCALMSISTSGNVSLEPTISMAGQHMQAPRAATARALRFPLLARTRARTAVTATQTDDSAAKAAAAATAAQAVESADAAAVVAAPTDKPLWNRRGTLIANIAMVIGLGGIALPQSGLLQPQSFKGADDIMRKRSHGTCVAPLPPRPLRWNADFSTADNICCFNRAFAEMRGYWRTTSFLKTESAASGEITFYDTITGKPLFIAPRGRSFEDFIEESSYHGWPSFRDAEVVSENVRVLFNGETVSADGTHLGHNIPDLSGNRFCINLVSIAGSPEKEAQK